MEREFDWIFFEVGPTELFSKEKIDGKVKRYFERVGKLNEFREYTNEKGKRPDFQLLQEHAIQKSDESIRVPFYEILEQEGITWDAENYLRLDGEKVAYVGEQIMPLEGKQEQLRQVLSKIVELRREFSYPDEILPQADKIAYDFGQFWKNINRPIEESKDPFVQTLIHLNELPECNPEEELRQVQLQGEFGRDQIKLKLLEELERTKVYKRKKWEVIPTTEMVMNPGYEEFFHNHLGDYSTLEVYGALKDLEKELAGDSKIKIRALRKEFEKKEGISRRKKVAILAGSLMAGASGLYVVSQLTVARIPPVIKNLKWEPTRIVNDKVYDGMVSFVAEGEEPAINISNATLEFIPKIYSRLPKEAFPSETMRRFNLIPVDGKFDELKEEFAVNITDIIGGREYDVKAIVKDRAGSTGVSSLTTPYIREFENIAPLDDILVGAIYYPWYNSEQWRRYGSARTPLLGYYNSEDIVVVNKHIDWATGHGIDFFPISWDAPYKDWDIWVKQVFLKASEAKNIKFHIFYGPGSYEWGPENKTNTFIEHMEYVAKTYFDDPGYLKIKERPVILFYDLGSMGEVPELAKVLNYLNSKSGQRIYWVGDLVNLYNYGQGYGEDLYRVLGATTFYFFRRIHFENDWEELLSLVNANYPSIREEMKKFGTDFIPSVYPSYDNRHMGGEYYLPRDPVHFSRYFEIAKRVAEPKVMLITSWNEWHEDTQIEPASEYKFDYLNIIRQLSSEKN